MSSAMCAALAVFVAVLGVIASASAGPDASPYRPGCWVPLPASVGGVVTGPGAATVVEAGRGVPQYALPLTGTWPGTADCEFEALGEGGWLVAECGELARKGVTRDAILGALPAGSRVLPLGDVRRGVSESVDLVLAYDFGESRLQPQERAALIEFVRRGGAVFFVFVSPAMPSSSAALWRELFGLSGGGDRQEWRLPQGLLVPEGFTVRSDEQNARLVWQPCGRGVVLAFGAGRGELETVDSCRALVGRAAGHVRAVRRTISVRPIDPAAFGLFGEAGWGAWTRRALGLSSIGYALAASGLVLSFGGMLMRRRWTCAAGLVILAACGAAFVAAGQGGSCGLALETSPMLIEEPGCEPVEVVVARITRLASGGAPRLRSACEMPAKLVLYSRSAAAEKTWVRYRFEEGGSSAEPLLESGQSMCLVSVRPVSAERAREMEFAPSEPEPANGAVRVAFLKERWARGGQDYAVRWVRPAAPPRAFDGSADSAFVQSATQPVLILRVMPRTQAGS